MTGPTLLAISSFLSRLLGVFRNNRLASFFGTDNGVVDAYFAAFQITDLVYNLILFGAISAAFIPIFSSYLAKKDYKNAWNFTNNLLNFLLIVVICVCLIIFIFAPILLKLIYPGFSEQIIYTTTNLVRIMIIAPIFFGISGIASSIQNAFHTFLAYSLSPILYNISIIFGIIVLGPIYGIYGVAIGVVGGAFLHMAIQLPVIFKKGYKYSFILNIKRSDFKKTILLAIPRIFGLAIQQINFIIEGSIASTIAIGSLTIYKYAQDIQSFPIGIIGLSIAICSFGILSKYVANKNYEKFYYTIKSNIKKILFLSIPASIGIFVLRTEIITLILGYGKFTKNIDNTSYVLGILCINLIFLSILPLLTRSFYSLFDSKTPVILGIITIIINFSVGLYFSNIWGIYGLATAGVIAYSFNFFAHIYFLNKKISLYGILPSIFDIKYFLQILFFSIIMGISVYYIKIFISSSSFCLNIFNNMLKNIEIFLPFIYKYNNTFITFFISSISSFIGVVLYFTLTYKIEENILLLKKFKIKKS